VSFIFTVLLIGNAGFWMSLERNDKCSYYEAGSPPLMGTGEKRGFLDGNQASHGVQRKGR
jgi:hypothetical protein